MRLRPAEKTKHAIAHVLGDMPLEASHRTGHRVLIARDHLTHIFRIELAGQGRGPHEIEEHHRQVSTFSVRRLWR